jgi:hypothetical protein
MGIESFGVLLRSERHFSIEEINTSIRLLESVNVVFEGDSESSYEYFDGKHLYEILISGSNYEAEFDVNVRFALCNYESIDLIFIKFVSWVISKWNPSIYLHSSLLKEKVFYDKSEAILFCKNVQSEIKPLRKMWQQQFGTKQEPVRVENVFMWLENNTII